MKKENEMTREEYIAGPMTEMMKMAVEHAKKTEREAILLLLKGIDKDQCDDENGWWETSTGANFGASIVAAIRARGNK